MKTCLEKYGETYATKTKEIKNKIKNTNIKLNSEDTNRQNNIIK